MKISCFAIFEKENKIVFVIDKEKPGLKLPGGKLEGDEFLKECLKREVKEETGFEIEVGNLISIDNYINKQEVLCLKLYFKAKYISGEEKKKDEEIKEIVYLDKDKVKDLKESDFCRSTYYQAVQDYLSGQELKINF